MERIRKFVFVMMALSGLVPMTGWAFNVKGRIIEAETGEPCSGAQYKIFSQNDTVKAIINNVADFDGIFNQKIDKSGKYLFEVSYVGMRQKNVPFEVNATTPDVDLGTIVLQTESEMLGELVVTAKKKLVESDGATLTYNVEDDPESSSNSVMQMLRKVPMVTVDADDNISINGDSNFKILVNGREDPMFSGDTKTILKAMPASAIKKFEVITEPGAKYDAEGTGGILNIVTTTKQTVNGYLANLSLRASNDTYGASAYGRGRIDNVTASANINYANAIDQGYVNTFSTLLENLTDDQNRYQLSDSRLKFGFHYLGGSLNLSWEPDTLNLFTVQGNVGSTGMTQMTLENVSMTSLSDITQWRLNRNNTNKMDNLWLGANTSFQHTFKKQGHHLIGSYIFGYGKNDGDQTTFTYDEENYIDPTPWRKQDSNTKNFQHTFQIDYANPIDGHNLLEAGVKGNWQRNTNLSIPYYGSSEFDLQPSDLEKVKVEQFRDIMAAYLSYTGNFGKWNTKVGLRYEYTSMGLKYKIGDYTDFTTHLNDIVPNVALTYRIKDATNLRLAYQMRISRPGINVLNPYENTMQINQVNYGNPDLDSEKSNLISLTYTNYGGRLGGSASVTYNRIDNMITNYSFMENNILHTTYANIGHNQSTRLNVNLQWSPVSSLNIGAYLSGSYVDIKADSPELKARNYGWSGSFNMNVDYTFPFKLRLSAYGGASTRNISLQSTTTGFNFYGLSLSRSFLKGDKLTVTAFASNFIAPYRKFHRYEESETFRTTTDMRMRQWSAGVSISLRLGGLRTDVRKTGAELEMMEGETTPNVGL